MCERGIEEEEKEEGNRKKKKKKKRFLPCHTRNRLNTIKFDFFFLEVTKEGGDGRRVVWICMTIPPAHTYTRDAAKLQKHVQSL